MKRLDNFMDTNRLIPKYINMELEAVDVSKPATPTPAPVQPTAPQKSFLHWQLEQALGGAFNNVTEAYELVKNQKYSYYYNDKYNYEEELTQLINRWGLNCADFSQVLNMLLVALNQEGKGYDGRFVHVWCRDSNGNPQERLGHFFMEVKGGEFGGNWTVVDFAEAASGKGAIGSTMCSNGYEVQDYQDPQLLVDGAES
jgi:hypothetical protein